MKMNHTAVETGTVMTQSCHILKRKQQPLASDSGAAAVHEDAARLEISTCTRNRADGAFQVLRGIQNSVSQLQIADQDLDQIHAMLQQGKKLADQAIEVRDMSEKEQLQNEINVINRKINQFRIGADFNTTYSANPDNQEIITALKSDWLEMAEDVIEKRYGLSGDGADLEIVLDEDSEPYLAAIMYNYDRAGKATDQTMHIAVKTAIPAALPNGGKDPGQYDDRVVTHEMVHVIMGRTMNFMSLPDWFKEGTAEFIHGPNERVALDLARNGGGMKGAVAIQDALGDGTDKTWASTSLHYSAASMAVRYLHAKIKEDGHSGGVKDLLADLKMNPAENLDQALRHVSRYANVKDFIHDYVNKGNGARFIHNLDITGEFKNAQAGGDTGAIGGAAVDGGPVQTAESVIPDINHPTETPLKHFRVIWPVLRGEQGPKQGNTAATVQRSIDGELKVNSHILGTDQVDLVNHPVEAGLILDKAISYVADKKTQLSRVENALRKQASQIAPPQLKDPDLLQQGIKQVKVSLGKPEAVAGNLIKLQPERVLQLLKSS